MKYKIFSITLITSLCLFPLVSHAKKEQVMNIDGKSALKGLFIKAQSCNPVLGWKELRTDPSNETYDVTVHYALFKNLGGPPDLGDQVFYLENIKDSTVQVSPSLKPKTRYIWSVRVRNNSNQQIGGWFIHDTVRATFLDALVGITEFYYKVWPGFKTPKECVASAQVVNTTSSTTFSVAPAAPQAVASGQQPTSVSPQATTTPTNTTVNNDAPHMIPASQVPDSQRPK